MRGLIVDYAGVLDGSAADADSWKQLLSELRMSGIGVAILSNMDVLTIPEPMARWKEAGYVDEILLSGDIGFEKPHPEAFLAAAEALGESHKECVVVDDSIVNVHSAVQTGFVVVNYTAFDRTEAELRPLFDLH